MHSLMVSDDWYERKGYRWYVLYNIYNQELRKYNTVVSCCSGELVYMVQTKSTQAAQQ